MNHKLLQQLQAAGFRFKYDHFGVVNDKVLYPGLLSELMEACGEKLSHIFFEYPKGQGRPKPYCLAWSGEPTKSNFQSTMGRTPEEAVAKLWLALNSKPSE